MGRDLEKQIRVTFFIGTKHINSASMNRFLCIAQATSKNIPVRVVGVRPTKYQEELKEKVSGIDKNPFIFKLKKSNKNTSIGKIIINVQSYYTLYKYLKKTKNSKFKEIFYIRSVKTLDQLVFYYFKKIFKAKLVIERNEYPTNYFQNNRLKWFFEKNLILPWSHKIFDGIIVITQTLLNFYRPYLSKESFRLHLPMTVDTDRFEDPTIKITKYKGDYLFYSGSLLEEKDGVETLIQAFQNLQSTTPDIKLIIAGGSNKEILRLKKTYKTDDENIIFLGTIPSGQIPSWIFNAKTLLLPRPHSIQAEGGFPTKLGEYLISGNPVIATPVGEIPNYLKHKRDVYFLNELNPEELSKLIIHVLQSDNEREKVGSHGKKTALEHFDYKVYYDRMDDYFMSLY